MPLTAIELLEVQNWTAVAGERLATLADLAGDYEPPEYVAADADPFAGIPDAHGEADWRF